MSSEIDLAHQPWAAELLQFWFEELEPQDWFKGSGAVDAALRSRFEKPLQEFGRKFGRKFWWETADAFMHTPALARAAILLFDQVPRNIYRGTRQAFAFDPLARALSMATIAKRWDEGLPDGQRQFVAMPLMHSEDLADQDDSLAYFTRHLPGNAAFARSHHEMIARFGRFPHRNAVLGRETTEEEQRAIDEGFNW